MKKVVSMLMALVMVFTMGPNVVVRAQDECVGDACRLGPDAPQVQGNASLTGWAWCKENPTDCIVYGGETAWNKTNELGEKAWNVTRPALIKAWDGTTWIRGKIANGAMAAYDSIVGYNYTQFGENVKWCAHNVGDCADVVYGGTKKWFGDRADDVAAFKHTLEDFCDYDLADQAQGPFWAMVGLAAYKGAEVALSVTKLAGKAAWGTVKLGGKVIMLPARFAMKLFSPCYRAAFGG